MWPGAAVPRAEPLAYISAAAEAYFVFERMLVTSSANALCIETTREFRNSKQEACFDLEKGQTGRQAAKGRG